VLQAPRYPEKYRGTTTAESPKERNRTEIDSFRNFHLFRGDESVLRRRRIRFRFGRTDRFGLVPGSGPQVEQSEDFTRRQTE